MKRDVILRAEVMREFGEVEQDEWQASEHAQFLPPWRTRGASGELGPFWGPTTESRLLRLLEEYNSELRGAIGSPAIWDEAYYRENWKPRQAARRLAAVVERDDGEAVREFVTTFMDELPDAEVKVAFAFWWPPFKGREAIARERGVAKGTVDKVIARIRAKVKERNNG